MPTDSLFSDVVLAVPYNPASGAGAIYTPNQNVRVVSVSTNGTTSTTIPKNYPSSRLLLGDAIAFNLTQPVVLNSTSFTLEGWIRLSSVGTPSAQTTDSQYLVRCFQTETVFTNDFILGVDRSGRPFSFLGAPTASLFAIGADSLSAGVWYHMAAVVNASTNKLTTFLDGSVVAETSISSPTDIQFSNISLFRSSPGTAQIIDGGSVQDVRVTKNARYLAAFTPPSALQVQVSGNVTRADGLPPSPKVVLRSWPDMRSHTVSPDGSGVWSAWLINAPHDVLYIADGTAPVAHGLYAIG